MVEKIRKPANWESSSFEDLFTIEAGQAYVAEQFGGSVAPVKRFHSSRTNADACSYDLFDDGSIWYRNNAQDEVWADAVDFLRELRFDGLDWDEYDGSSNMIVDEMDRDLLVHLWGEDEAREFFESGGGNVDEVDVMKTKRTGTITWDEINGIGVLTCEWSDGTKETVEHPEPIHSGTDSAAIAALFGCEFSEHDKGFIFIEE